MRIAFYAPLKAPDSPVPSGDRRIARLLIRALESRGHEVVLLSRFRAFEGTGDAARSRRLRDLGRRLGARAARRLASLLAGARPEAVFTYHVYDKAPDWIGPQAAAALGVPYLICEASLNPARATGALEIGYQGAKAAIGAADAILEINPADRLEVAAALKPGAVIRPLAPFLDDADIPTATPAPSHESARATLAKAIDLNTNDPWLLSVAMMRPGDKLASYRILADGLVRLTDRPWRLLVAGDGAARADVEATFQTLGPDRVRFLGLREGAELAEVYAACDIFAWPAINEALGMAILEAQAAGLPVVAGHQGAIGTIVADGETGLLTPAGDAGAFAGALADLIAAPDRAAKMGQAARTKMQQKHGIATAAKALDTALTEAARSRKKPRPGACVMTQGRVLVFVQHLRGIGHLQRAAVLARAMVDAGLSVDLVSGGMPVSGIDLAGMTLHQLPPVRSPDDTYTRLVDAEGRPADADLHRRRIADLLGALETAQPDIVMVEMFPFGRSQIAQEFIALIEAARAAHPRPRIVSSVRDIIATKREHARYDEMADQVIRWFDAVLVHGDPDLLPLDESFPAAEQIRDRLHYTGYVLSPAPGAGPAGNGDGEVLVSAGGGAFGAALMWAALEARNDPSLDPALATAPWSLLTGPNIPPDEAARLETRAGGGIRIERMRPDFRSLLTQARASVSQCGYNTSMEVLDAGRPAVLVPFGQGRQTEQHRRAAALSRLGLAETVMEAELNGANLTAALNHAISGDPRPKGTGPAIDMSGAETTARLVRRWVSERLNERAPWAASSI